MRHRHGLRKLNRTSSHRLAMLRNMSNSLLQHELIKTTLPKAKELRKVVEPLITLAKKDTVANRRLAFARLRDRDMVTKLFNELGPRFATRPGGYTRILKFGFRQGDNAPMALVELLDDPQTCPHGNPIPGMNYVPPGGACSLGEFAVDGAFTVERIPEELEFEPGQLAFLENAGIMPGQVGTVLGVGPDGTTTVSMDGKPVGIGSFAADRILVTPAPG